MNTKENWDGDSQTHNPEPGDLWEFPVGAAEVVGWAVLKVHPEDPNLFLVAPVDIQQAVGPRDLAVPQIAKDGSSGRIVLRGDWTRWVSRDDFWFCAAKEVVPREWRREFLARIQEALGAARAGGGSLIREEALEWGEHLDWVRDTLKPTDTELERWERRESLREVVQAQGDSRGDSGESVALAASGLSDLTFALAVCSEASEPAPETEWELFNLFVVKGPAGGKSKTFLYGSAGTVYFELDAELAPRDAFVLGSQGGRTFLQWNKTIRRKWRSQPLRLTGKSLRVVVAGDPMVEVDIEFAGDAKA